MVRAGTHAIQALVWTWGGAGEGDRGEQVERDFVIRLRVLNLLALGRLVRVRVRVGVKVSVRVRVGVGVGVNV